MSECFKCKGYCCRYVTVDLAKPVTFEDFDEIRWFILHENVIVYKAEDETNWRVEFRTPCKYLDESTYLCKGYDKRPVVCRDYITDECAKERELTSDGCDVYMENESDLREYLQENKPRWVKRMFFEE